MFACRCCLVSTAELIDLSSTMTVSNGNICMSNDQVLTVAECLHICTDLDFDNENPKLPNMICEDCYCELKVSFEFRAKCENSDLVLRNRYKLSCVERNDDGYIEESVHELQIESVVQSSLGDGDDRVYEDCTVVIEVLDDSDMVGEKVENELEFVKEMSIKSQERSQSDSRYTNLVEKELKFGNSITGIATNLDELTNYTSARSFQEESTDNEIYNGNILTDHYAIKEPPLDRVLEIGDSRIKQDNRKKHKLSYFQCEICEKILGTFRSMNAAN